MSSHIHLFCKATDGFILSDVIRDFKKLTSNKINQTIINEPEYRREWMLDYFANACENLKENNNLTFGKIAIMQNIFMAIRS